MICERIFNCQGGFVDDKNLPLNPGDDFIKPEVRVLCVRFEDTFEIEL